MQIAICLPVQKAGSPVPAAKDSSDKGGDFMQTLAGIMRRVSVEQGSMGRRANTGSFGADGDNAGKTDKSDTGGTADAALTQPMLASLIVAFQAGMAQVSPAVPTAAGGENSPAQDQTLSSGLMASSQASGIVQVISFEPQSKGADIPGTSTGSGLIARDGPTGVAGVAAGTGKQTDLGIDTGNIPAGQAAGVNEGASPQSNINFGAFKANPAAYPAAHQANMTQAVNTQIGTKPVDQQTNMTQAINTHTGNGTIAGTAGTAAITAPQENSARVQLAAAPQTPDTGTVMGNDTVPQATVSPAAEGTRHTAADNTARYDLTSLQNESTMVVQQPIGPSAASVAYANANVTPAVFVVKAKDDTDENVFAVKPQAGAVKQDGLDIARAVRSSGGANEGQRNGRAKDDDGKGGQTDAADFSNAAGLFAVKSGQVGSDELKAKPPDVTDLARQLSDVCKSAADQGKSEIRVHLSPETLGGINIKIVSQNGALSVQISADSRQTGNLLQSNLIELNRSMNDNGVNMNKVEVYYSSSGAFDASTGSFGGRQQNYEGNEGAAAAWVPVEQVNDEIAPSFLNNGRMSIFA